MRTREANRIKKSYDAYKSWSVMEDDASQNQAKVAKAKLVEMCEKFGGCDHFCKWSKNDVSCKNCDSVLKTVCAGFTQEEVEAAAARAAEERAAKAGQKRVGNGDMERCVTFMVQNPLFNRKAVQEAMLKGSERSAGGWKTMIGALSLALKNLDGKGTGKGAYHHAAAGIAEGIVTFKELKAYVAGKEGKTEGAVGRSVQYVFTAWKVREAVKTAGESAESEGAEDAK